MDSALLATKCFPGKFLDLLLVKKGDSLVLWTTQVWEWRHHQNRELSALARGVGGGCLWEGDNLEACSAGSDPRRDETSLRPGPY